MVDDREFLSAVVPSRPITRRRAYGSLRALRDQIDDLSARLDANKAIVATIPGRERYVLLDHRLGRRIVEAHAEWLDEMERELGS